MNYFGKARLVLLIKKLKIIYRKWKLKYWVHGKGLNICLESSLPYGNDENKIIYYTEVIIIYDIHTVHN